MSNFDLNLQVNQFNLATLTWPGFPGKIESTVHLESPGENSPVPAKKPFSQLPFMSLAIAGLVDFNGRLRGQLSPDIFQNQYKTIQALLLKSQFSIIGDLKAQNLAVNDWQFVSPLVGRIKLDTDRQFSRIYCVKKFPKFYWQYNGFK